MEVRFSEKKEEPLPTVDLCTRAKLPSRTHGGSLPGARHQNAQAGRK
jgi:hypothetical protein